MARSAWHRAEEAPTKIVRSDDAPGRVRREHCPGLPNTRCNRRIHMPEAYIVAAARTAGGRRNGRLSGWHPADLAAQVLNALVERTDADPALVEDVIMGCVGQAGEQASNVARNAVLASRLPESVPGTSVDRQC